MIYSVAPKMPQMISTVCLALNEILLGEELHDLLNAHKHAFPQSNIDGPTLSLEIMKLLPGRRVLVRPYAYPWYKYQYNYKVIAHVNDAKSIQLTKYFLGVNDDVDYACTLSHETVHVIDNLTPYWFGHGSNDPTGDELTAPHVIGDICARIYKKRRDASLIFAARESEETYSKALAAIGADKLPQLVKLNARGVYDFGADYGTAEKNSFHVVD